MRASIRTGWARGVPIRKPTWRTWMAAISTAAKITTDRLHFHFSLSCIGEENGNPLQCSCLENPRDGGAWWAAVYGVAQSWTRLKRLSRSSSSSSKSPLDCKEIQPVHSKGDQPWDFFGENDSEAETPVLWPPHAKS